MAKQKQTTEEQAAKTTRLKTPGGLHEESIRVGLEAESDQFSDGYCHLDGLRSHRKDSPGVEQFLGWVGRPNGKVGGTIPQRESWTTLKEKANPA